MVPGIFYSWSWTILLDELEMYQFFATLSDVFIKSTTKCQLSYKIFRVHLIGEIEKLEDRR